MTAPTMPVTAQRPPWKEPLVWLVLGIPGLTIVAGLITWWIAAQRADSDVADDHYRRGLGINRVLQREDLARSLGVKARITLPATGPVSVELHQDGARPEALVLSLTHPVRAEQDRRITLAIQPDGRYRPLATAAPDAGWPTSGRWTVSLESSAWRLTGLRQTLRPGVELTLPASDEPGRAVDARASTVSGRH